MRVQHMYIIIIITYIMNLQIWADLQMSVEKLLTDLNSHSTLQIFPKCCQGIPKFQLLLLDFAPALGLSCVTQKCMFILALSRFVNSHEKHGHVLTHAEKPVAKQ